MKRQFAIVRAVSRRARTDENGFTLVELLVVIVVLGILSGIVLLSVRGTGDKGSLAAAKNDARTLRTAEETNCAKHHTYASEDGLVANGLLAEVSSIHDVVVTPSGNCSGTGFSLTCDFNQLSCGADGTVPDGNFAGSAGAAAAGAWKQAGSLPFASPLFPIDLVAMPNGKLLLVANSGTTWKAAVYDAARDGWSAVTDMPTPNQTGSRNWMGVQGNLVVLQGSPAECGGLCGQVLVRTFGPATAGSAAGVYWKLFDPMAFESGANPWRNVADAPFVQGNSAANTSGSVVQLRCSRTSPTSDCGKVLSVGGTDDWAPNRTPGGTADPAVAQTTSLFDPTQDPSSPAVWSQGGRTANQYRQNYRTVGLANGKVLTWGGYNSPIGNTTTPNATSEIYDPATHSWTPTANQNLWCTTTNTTTGVKRPITAFSDGFAVPFAGGTKVLVAGGFGVTAANCPATGTQPADTPVAPAQSLQKWRVFEVATNSWGPISGSLCACKQGRGVALPAAYGGKVLLISGATTADAGVGPVQSASLFDPAASTWSDPSSGQLPSRSPGSLAGIGQLPTGQVIVAGAGPAPYTRTDRFTPPVPPT
ncbi:MAG TPA: prepilin-type N-terminal cleavage/methylation domain-containing protein [Mycobacterium sp.]|nr:prepilin-type N-terminal cleavage/methylation domain-containing protein [Mycobacterium sp.]